MRHVIIHGAAAIAFAGLVAAAPSSSEAGQQDAVDACIDGVRAEAGGGGGQVLSADKMGKDWYVHLEDASGGEWDCYASDDGRLEQLTAVAPANVRGGKETREARRACRKAVRAKAGAGGIEVKSAEFSQANTLVMLTDGSGGEWRCLSSNSGAVAELTPVGGAAAAGGSQAEAACLAAVSEYVGGGGGLSVLGSQMGENYTTVTVDVPGAEKPWACEWGGNGVSRVYYTGEG